MRAANQAVAQPRLSLDLARVYVAAHDLEMTGRTWGCVLPADAERGRESSRERCQRGRRAFVGRDFATLRSRPLIETRAEDLLAVLASGKMAVNHYLSRLDDFAKDLNWLP